MNRIVQATLFALALCTGLLSVGPARAQGEFRGFSVAELDQMLAPVALYPDTVLSHVLIAATYPIEVVQAARWTRLNPGLRGEEAVNAVIGQDWDPSVMALVAFPEVLGRMDADLDWTQRLGDAFLIQEADVLESIQRLRAQAYSAGHLRSTEQVQVIREREIIYIEPPRRQVVFVPVYDTRVVFGSWAWAHHPPVFWHPPAWHRSRVVVYWGPAFHVPPAFFFSSFHWSRREVIVVHHHHHFFHPQRPWPHTVVHHHHHHHYRGRDLARHDAAQRWQHDPGHRRGVAYHPAVDERHRQLERRAVAGSAVQSAPPVRVADTRNDQRAWAESRRAQAILPQSGSEPARSVRSMTDTARAANATRPTAPARALAAESNPGLRAVAEQRAPNAGLPRSTERSMARASDPAATAGTPARAVERQLPQRSTTQREAGRPAPSASAPSVQRNPSPVVGMSQDARAAARVERQAQRPMSSATTQGAPAPRASAPPAQTRSMESRSSAPARPASTAPAPAPRMSAPPVNQPRHVPQREASAPPARMPELRAAPAQRPVMQDSAAQRQAPPAARPEARPPAADRRAVRQVD